MSMHIYWAAWILYFKSKMICLLVSLQRSLQGAKKNAWLIWPSRQGTEGVQTCPHSHLGNYGNTYCSVYVIKSDACHNSLFITQF